MTIMAAAMTCLAPCAFASPANSQGSPLIIQVSGVPSNRGLVRVNVCTLGTFLKGGCPYSGAAPAVQGVTTVTVNDVPPGVYAVQLFDDPRDLGHVDRGVFGIPKVAIGFSNNAPVGLHGPKFGRASFIHGDDTQTITVTLRRFGPGARQIPPTQEAAE
ncbi:MAG: DUF2141 domain-containing protein [Caulobacteraceae bacterium]|nr:DUF2141 domain-containing protein [Caulobacteraceae bacterium]